MPFSSIRRSWPLIFITLVAALFGVTVAPIASAETLNTDDSKEAPITFRMGDRVLNPGEKIKTEDGGFVRIDCSWVDEGTTREFQAYLWAPTGEAAVAQVPDASDTHGLDGGLNVHSGFLLLQGLTGSRPRSKSGGGRATGHGTTIVLWASQLGRPRLHRSACLAGRCDVEGLQTASSDNIPRPLSTQFCTRDSYMEWDSRAVTSTDGSAAIRRPIAQNTDFESAIRRMLRVTGVTPR